LQIVKINYKYFPSNTHNNNRLVVFNYIFLNELKMNWAVNHYHLIYGDYLDLLNVVMKCTCTKNCRKSESSLSFSYENTMTEGANMRPVKACAPR